MSNDELLKEMEKAMNKRDAKGTCPSCGYCPTCGHRPWGALPSYPYYPNPYLPWVTWGGSATLTTTTSPETTVYTF